MPAITAILNTPEDASAAVAALRREGVPRDAITVMSAEPLHIVLPESDQEKSHIGAFAIVGGLIGAACAILLTVLTSRRVDLVTGGMPIVTPWAFGIIVFELTALGAILATLGRMIFEAKLARRVADYDEAVADGRVVLKINCDDEPGETTARRILGDNLKPTS